MQSTLYEAEHEAFRESVRAFVAKHVVPFHAQWEQDGMVDREIWVEAGKQGLLGADVPEQYGGGGTADFRYNCVVNEELVRVGASGVGFTLHPFWLALTGVFALERVVTVRARGVRQMALAAPVVIEFVFDIFLQAVQARAFAQAFLGTERKW